MSTQTLYAWKGSNPILWIIAFFSYLQDNTHHFSFLFSVGFPCLNPSSSRKGAGWVHFCTLSICQVDMWLYVNPSCSWPDLNSQPLIFDSSNIWNSQVLWTLLLNCPGNPSACFCSHVGVSLLVSLLSDLLPVSILLSVFGGRWRASSIPQCSQHDCNVITVMVALITCLGDGPGTVQSTQPVLISSASALQGRHFYFFYFFHFRSDNQHRKFHRHVQNHSQWWDWDSESLL